MLFLEDYCNIINKYTFLITFIDLRWKLIDLINNLTNIVQMLKQIFIIFSTIAIVTIWLIAESSEYFPNIIAPFTQIHAIFLGVVGIFTNPTQINMQSNKKPIIYWSIILTFLALYSAVNLHLSKIYPFSLQWIVTSIILLSQSKSQKVVKSVDCEIQFQDFNATPKSDNSYHTEMLQKVQNQLYKRKSCKKKIFFLVYVFFILLFTYNTHIISNYGQKFPIIGNTITMKLPQSHHRVTIHYYCSDVHYSKYPTIVLQHGGGGNLVGFLPLLKELQTKGIKLCVYDRLGYGRSSKMIPNLSLKERISITEFMFSLLFRQNEKIIYGGWSAGVQIAMAYSQYFPDKVVGLIFIDGYPDYLILQAIQANASEVRNPHTLFISKIFRFIQPYAFDLFFGANQIQNTTFNQYYEAYYRTGYLWDSQQTQLKFQSSTQEISELGKQSGSVLPYPNAKIYLNWPNTKVPLLVMPANNTISGSNGLQYKIQSEKYIEKCTNNIKRLEVIEGSHDFVTKAYEKVAKVIGQFVEEVVTLN